MSGLSQILEVARRALMAQQVGIGVAGHNIANASRPGYSRQRVELAATEPSRTTVGLLGTGVIAKHVGRLRQQFIDQQVRLAHNSLEQASTQQRILSQIEATLNEPSDAGLSAAINRFLNAFQNLAIHPEETATRNDVLQQGVLLTQSFRRLNSALKQLRSDLVDDINARLTRINSLTKEISELDVQITNAQAVGLDASDAKDQRDLKLEELSKLANINVSEDSRGSVMVSLGGTMLASRAGSVALSAVRGGDEIRIVSDQSSNPITVNSGELGGVLQLYNMTLPAYQDKLNQIAGALITRVNTLHAAGFGIGDPPPTGNNFFSGSDAESIGIDPIIKSSVNTIAASADGTPGDNRVALAIAAIDDEPLLNGNTVSVLQAYNSLVSEVGFSINAAENTASAQELILAQLENQRNAVSGVSLDEEMTNLIKFQRSFDAAARVVNVVQELFETILKMV